MLYFNIILVIIAGLEACPKQFNDIHLHIIIKNTNYVFHKNKTQNWEIQRRARVYTNNKMYQYHYYTQLCVLWLIIGGVGSILCVWACLMVSKKCYTKGRNYVHEMEQAIRS